MARIDIFDLHCDTLDRLALHSAAPELGFSKQDAAIPAERMASLADNDAHVALGRMLGAGYGWCQCFAAFIPDGLGAQRSWGVFETVRDFFRVQLEQHAALIEQVRDARDIRRIVDGGKCAGMLTVEGGSFIEGDVSRVHAAADAGVKMLTLTWNGKNAIASGNQTGDGLTSFGRQVIAAMEERRVAVDVSHLNDRSFWDVVEASKRPIAASHSNVRSVCGHPRNLTDDQVKALVERRGVIGLNFCRDFLREDGADPSSDDVLRHIDRFLALGAEHALALGSDYDGCDVPSWLDPAEKVGALHDLIAQEFGDGIAEAICFGNAHAFFTRNEAQ